jgi:hypothetical protein
MIRTAVLLVVVLALITPALLPTPAKAWTAANYGILWGSDVPQLWEDAFYKYDHESKSTGSSNVDWPVTLVFTMEAEVPLVIELLWGGACIWDATMYGRCSDQAPGNFEWYGTKGSKTCGDPWYTFPHVRPYAPKNVETGKRQFENLSLHYYVIGTSHYDNYPSLNKFGYSEWAEEAAVDRMHNQWGYYVWNDYYDFKNYEPYRVEGNHYWYSNGWASEIMIF